jgi:hypothetical protein
MKLTVLVFALGAFAACSSSDGGSGGQDAGGGGGSNAVCGDGVCAASEVTSCSSDCGDAPYCGDNICQSNESTSSCANDCGGGGQGSGSGSGGGSGSGTGSCPSTPSPEDCLGCLFDPTMCPAGFTDGQTCITCALGGGGGSGFGDFGCDDGSADGTCSQDEMDLGGSAVCSDCP